MEPASSLIDTYFAGLPLDRREAMKDVRKIILSNLPKGYEEGILYGMVSYYVPLEVFSDTYNGKPLSYIALASQKNYISLYLMSVYGENEKSFRDAYVQTGKKLNMGKSCVRFKKYEDLPVELIAKAVGMYTPAQFVARYKASRA